MRRRNPTTNNMISNWICENAFVFLNVWITFFSLHFSNGLASKFVINIYYGTLLKWNDGFLISFVGSICFIVYFYIFFLSLIIFLFISFYRNVNRIINKHLIMSNIAIFSTLLTFSSNTFFRFVSFAPNIQFPTPPPHHHHHHLQ